MDSGSSCLCDSSDPTDPTEYLEILKKKYLERTAKLQAQQRELEQKIVKMEAFIGKSKDPSKPLQSSCQCVSPVVPKVFPETPVRDVPTIPKTMTDVIQNQQPVSQQCSFFQKMMENAKNILSLSCQCPAAPNITQGTATETPMTTTISVSPPNTMTTTPQNTTTTATDATYSELPTKDNDRSEQQNVVDYDNTLTDKSSRTSTCSCDFTDPSTLQEASCSCHIADTKASTMQQSQQVSIEHSSSSPKEQTDVDPLTSSVSKTEKCPWKNTVTSELASEECSCELCKCTSSIIMDGKQLDTDNGPAETVPANTAPVHDVLADNIPKENIPLPTVTVFLEKGDSPDAGVQVAAPVESRGVHSEIPKDTASKCVTCCRNAACPKIKHEKGKGDNLSAGVQVAASTTNKGVNIQKPTSVVIIGNEKAKNICRGKCNPGAPPKERRQDSNQDQQAVPNRQDGQNQCAFIGSPLLTFDSLGTTKSTSVTGPKSTNTATSSSKFPCNCNTPQGPKKMCPVSNFSLNSNDILEMQSIAELAKKEKEIKVQIADLQKREKQYQEATRNVETLASKTNSHCCCCCQKRSPSMDNDIEKIGRELRLENQILKSELEDMKMELKHCLEKVEGPMKHKLETEKQKCECLQKELQAASKNMLVNQDAYAREMSQLKLQLCCACNNITELNQMNQRLKDEMSQLDCLCQKLEDDLIKQKVSEAETIKRLTGRKYGGEPARSQPSEEIRCESSLDLIARKLSKTLKELAPCDECSTLPTELAGAARCIKDLTDMVRKRKTKSLATNACNCQSRPPSKPPSKSFSEEEECCTCCGPRDGGGESAGRSRSPEEKVIKTLHQVPKSFVQKDQSSKFDVHHAQSSYYSAQGEPVREMPCAHIGTPCVQSKATLAKEEPPKKDGKRPCSGIGEPCNTAQSTSRHKPVQVSPKEDKMCKASCSGILQPVKDQKVQEALDAEKEPVPQEKPVQVPEEPRQADKGCSASCEFMKKVKTEEEVPSKTKSLEKAVSEEKPMPSEKGEEPEESTLSEEREIKGLLEGEQPPADVEGEPKLKEKESKVKEEEIPDELESTPIVADMGKKHSSTSLDKKHIPETTLGLIPEEVTESAPDTTEVLGETSSPRTEAILPEEPISGAKGDSSREGVKDLPKDDTDETSPVKELPPNDADRTKIKKEPSRDEVEYEATEHPTKETPESREHAAPVQDMKQEMLDTVPELSGESGAALDTSAYDTEEGIEDYVEEEKPVLIGPATEHESKTLPHDHVQIGEREIPVEEERFGGEFPVDVGNKAFSADQPTSGLHITTTTTGSGTLEVITEGAGGTIETTLIYTEEGNIEVVTEMVEHPEGISSPTDEELEKFATKPSPKGPTVSSSTRPCTPDASCYTMKQESGFVICEPENVCHDMDKPGKSLVKAIPVDSSAISGVSGPEAETPYTPSSVTADDDLTSKLATDSSGIRPALDQTPDLTSASHRPATGSGVQAVPTMSPIPSLEPGSEQGKILSVGGKGSEGKAGSRADIAPSAEQEQATFMYDKSQSVEGRKAEMEQAGSKSTSPSGHDVDADQVPPGAGDLASSSAQKSSHQQDEAPENLISEALTSTTGELKSGDVFTPDQVGSEPEMQGRMLEVEAQIIVETYVPENISQPCEMETAHMPLDASAPEAKVELAELVTVGDVPTIAGLEVTVETPASFGLASSVSGQVEIMSGTSTVSKGPGSEIEDQITALRVKKSLYEEESQKAKTGSFEFTEVDDKIAIPYKGDSKVPATGPLGPRATRDCGCQSKDQTNQSCQCCECKTIGITTSGDKETTTEKDKEMGKTPHEDIEGTKTDTDSEFVTISENTDHAVAQRTSSKKAGDTLDDASSMPLSPSLRKETGKLSDLRTVVDEEMLEKHPQLRGKTSSEQEKILIDLGYVHHMDYMPQEITEDDISVNEEILAKHPELVGKTKSEQQQMLKEFGFKPSRQIVVDEKMLDKHPELAGKTSEEQQAILKDLGYAVSKPKVSKISGDHPSKDFEGQQDVLKSIIYSTPPQSKIKVTEDLILKHPGLADKDPKEQQEILKSLGYSTADTEAAGMKTHPEPSVPLHKKISAPGSIKGSEIDPELLEKHPELHDKSSEEQRRILQNLGYPVPEKKSTPIDKSESAFKPKREIDPELLKAHPELVDKSSEEQNEILQSLGYPVSQKISAPLDKSRSVVSSKVKFDQELLQKHPELIGKDSNEQRKILSELGYTTPELVATIKPEILRSHPELAGKTLEEQKELLQNMGYILDEVLELAVSDRRVVARLKPSEETFSTPQPSSKDVSVSCKAPCRSAAVPADILEKPSSAGEPAGIPKEPSDAAVPAEPSEAGIPKKPSEKIVILDITPSKSIAKSRGSASGISKQPSSKEVSVTCRAPCKSAATLHVTPQKQSEKSFSAVGTVSSTTVSKSRTVSLQKTPSSRDDSASCKASCRTMSVQSSGSRLAQSRREVREIVSSRTESSTTASSSDARSKEKSKKRDKAKSGPGEVPSMVSELSDIDRPVIESTKKPKSTRKKRMKAYDCMKCDCDDPCNCSVCAPGRKREPLKRPAKSCECPPNMMMIPPMVVVPPMQMTYSMPPTGHAANCRCNSCLYEQLSPSRADVQRRPQADSVTSDENEGHSKKHPPNCECVDCLCLPKIKKIANTKEYPVVYDKKQVYQVKVKCDTCTNAQNARRYLEQQQQSRSRIPISTTSANPPRVRSEPKQIGGSSDGQPAPAEQTKPGETAKEDDQKAGAPPLSASESVYNSVACDCPDCVCSECPDEKKRPPPKIEVVPKISEKGPIPTTPSAHAPQGDKNCCCKEKPCVCDPCTVEELTKKLKEAEEKLAAAKSQVAVQPSVIQGAPAEQGDECTCEICICPRSDLMPSEQGKPPAGIPSATKSPAGAPGGHAPGGDNEPCTCVECVCPGADQMAPTKVPSAAPPATQGPSPGSGGDDAHPDDCTCPECTCPGISDFKAGTPKQPSTAKQPSAIKSPEGGAGDEECDCKECVCPGKDLVQSRAGDIPIEACDCSDCKCSPCADPKVQAQKPGVEQPPGIADCDCIDCQCSPCADPKKQKDKKSKPDADKEEPHSEECDCSPCQCPEEVPPTSTTPTPPIAKDVTKDTEESKHGEDCDCPECACPYSPSKTKEGISAKESKFTDMPEKVPHPADCDCDECLCLEEILQKEVVAQTERGVQPQAEKEIHSSNCVCPECLCPECSTKATHAPGCMCGECLCSPCDKKEPGKAATGATPSAHATPGQAGDQTYHPTDCSCITCMCDACTDPSKKSTRSDDQPHADGCRCVQCLCNECPLKSAPVRHHEGCQCPQCACTECPKMTSQDDKPSQSAAPAVEELKAAASVAGPPQAAKSAGDHLAAVPSSAEEKERNCICENCICIECKGKGRDDKEKECTCPVCECVVCDKKPPAAKPPQEGAGEQQKQRSEECKCVTCICDPCIKGAEEPCKCPDCQCLVCDKKPIQSASPPQEGGGEQQNRSENCKCAICICNPCEKSPDEPCKCPDCQCLECDKKKDQTTKAGDQATHSPACTCSDCQCKPCFNMEKAVGTCSCGVCTCVICSKKMDGKTQQSYDQQQAPPSTTQQGTIGDQCKPEGDDCTCKVCTCLECSRKRPRAGDQEMGEKETHSPLCECSVCQCTEDSAHVEAQAKPPTAAGEGLDFTNPPPFEPFQRIDCNCNQCGCVICNMHSKAEEATQEGVPSVKKSSEHGAKAPSRTDQDGSGQAASEQRKAELPGDYQPPPFEAPIRIDCICQRCSCIFCNKEAPQRSVAAQPSIVRSVQKAVSVQPSLTTPGQGQAVQPSLTTPTIPSQVVTTTQSQCAVMQAASQVAAAIAASQHGPSAAQLAPPTAESQLIYQIAASQQAVQAGASQMQATAASQMLYQTAASQHATQAASQHIPPVASSQHAAAMAASQQAAAIAASHQAAMIAASQQMAATPGYAPLPGQSQVCADIAASQMVATAAPSQPIAGPTRSKIVTAAAPSKLRFQIPVSDTTTVGSQQIYQTPQSQHAASVAASQQAAAIAASQQAAAIAASQQAVAIAASQQAAAAAASQQIPSVGTSQMATPSNLIYQAAQSQQITPVVVSEMIPPVASSQPAGIITSGLITSIAPSQPLPPIVASQMAQSQHEATCPGKICSQIPPNVLAALIAASQQGVPTSQIAAQLAASQQVQPVGASQMFAPALVRSQQVAQQGASQMVTSAGASQVITPAMAASQQVRQPGASQMMTPGGASQTFAPIASGQQGVPCMPNEFCTKVAASVHAFQESQRAFEASQQAAPTIGSQLAAGETLHPKNCNCTKCICNPNQLGGAGHPPGCTCNLCTCGPCSFDPNALAAKESKPLDVIKPPGSSTLGGIPVHCDCPTCTCDEGVIQTTTFDKNSPPTTTVVSGMSAALYSSTTATSGLTQTTGPVVSGVSAAPGTTGEVYQSADTLVLPKPDVHKMYPPHPPECDCKQCLCMPCKDPNVAQSGVPTSGTRVDKSKSNVARSDANVKAMDDVTLVKSIQAANQESGAYKGQIDEIKKTLNKIKCACTEAEFRSTQSMGQSMSKDMGPISVKPFVKQASVFGQTMSGLKMALNNLQAKCKAKDRMIEAMTTELQQRGTSEVFNKVFDITATLPSALDYDTADDVKSLDRSQIATNVIHAPPEVRDEGTTPSALKVTASKGVEVRTHKHKKRKEKQSDKDPDCMCSKHQLIQKEEKDCQKLDLAGFEVVDIRRITDDSLIVKWNAPNNDQVQGYDIFVNGTLASKVMSGTRTSAMMHSLDLSKSIQITIYAVTGCGRVEPPAIAIYEIKS